MEYVKFKDVIINSQYGYTATETSQTEGTYKYLRITDIVPYYVNFDTVPFCKITEKDVSKYIVKEGDILIARTGATTGYNYVVPSGISNTVYASYLIRFIVDKKLVLPLFMKYVLKTQSYYGFINNYIGGSAQPGMNAKVFTKFNIPKLSLVTQQKIASILSSYDRLIENNTRRIRLLEQMAENLYKEWFVRFRFPEHENVEIVNGLPKGWKTIHIKELAQLKSGYAFKSEWFVEEGEAVAKIKDIGNILMDTSNFSYVDKENCIKAKKFLLTTGDLTIALTGATIGKISIVPKHKGNIYTNQRLGKFFLGDNPMEKLPFLYCLFKQESMVSNIVNLSNSSSAQPNISPEQIEKIKILGNHDIISMYNKTCNPLFSNILALYSQNQLLTRQRDLLLPRLMSGKLEVKS
ncbi:restriction endonuclease subunit S [Prevotella melaninogenica]|uniref:restriction endonuclease subunit S n=1 Tax=Prevotella melaninogenica TaxID=28132 RepID=UPI0001AEB51B|nr:restriction endonuclease subunit S [Prevotella melaninogenica]ADK96981.1 type I restriction modification DNA specificity domain protein [Prevotella melaninogenica ATCC 25845]ASE18847.1 restriction endonuclease subunit S [Prevotella melaninogenica]UEB08626.1 restriction endonuclease subunit S [Prevotella melaninogenica]